MYVSGIRMIYCRRAAKKYKLYSKKTRMRENYARLEGEGGGLALKKLNNYYITSNGRVILMPYLKADPRQNFNVSRVRDTDDDAAANVIRFELSPHPRPPPSRKQNADKVNLHFYRFRRNY